MTLHDQIKNSASAWIDAVVGSTAKLADRFERPRTIRIVQTGAREFKLWDGITTQKSGSFNLEVLAEVPHDVSASVSGSRVELVLQSDRFLYRPIELPNRATEFLRGIIRAQIDRLTPWSAAAAAFGWSEPVASGSQRVMVTVAATAKSFLEPFQDVLTRLGAHSIAILTVPPGDLDQPILVYAERADGRVESSGLRKALTMVLAASCIVAGVAVGGASIVTISLDWRQAEVTRQLAELRAAAGSAQQIVERRKAQAIASVIVLDALSEILPDHTYVIELRIESNKVRVIGVSHDAASLIGLIEKSGRFAKANFFAPTTRSPTETGERFHVEAIIQSVTASRS